VIGSIVQCLRGRHFLRDVADGKGRLLAPDEYDLTQFSGPVFVGNYGTGNYVVLTRHPASFRDPRIRLAWADPLRPIR
jgi:hypothetical protein